MNTLADPKTFNHPVKLMKEALKKSYCKTSCYCVYVSFIIYIMMNVWKKIFDSYPQVNVI